MRLKLPNRTQRAERAAKFAKLLNEQDEMPIRLGWHAGYKAALRDVHKALNAPRRAIRAEFDAFVERHQPR